MYLWLKALHIIALIAWMAGMLYASTVRLSRNGQAQVGIVGNAEDDGAAAVQFHHDAGDASHLDHLYLFASGKSVAGRRLVSCQVRCGTRHDRPARIICALGKRIPR